MTASAWIREAFLYLARVTLSNVTHFAVLFQIYRYTTNSNPFVRLVLKYVNTFHFLGTCFSSTCCNFICRLELYIGSFKVTRETILGGEITTPIQICTLSTRPRRDKERNCKRWTGKPSPPSNFWQDFSVPSPLTIRRFREGVSFSYILGMTRERVNAVTSYMYLYFALLFFALFHFVFFFSL